MSNFHSVQFRQMYHSIWTETVLIMSRKPFAASATTQYQSGFICFYAQVVKNWRQICLNTWFLRLKFHLNLTVIKKGHNWSNFEKK